MGTSVPLATWAIPCSKLCLAPLKALIRAAWFASSDQAALLLPKAASPKAMTSIRALFIMLTSCVLRSICASRNGPLLAIGYPCWSRGNSVDRRRLSADHLLQCLIDDFEFFALQEQHGGDSAAVLQVGNRTQRAEAGGFTKRLLDRLSQRTLRLGHCRALRLGRRQVLATRDWFDLCDLTGRIVDQHFGEFPVLRRIDRELKLAAIDLEFARDRLAFLFAGNKALLQADLGETAAPGNSISAVVVIFIIIVPQDGIVAGNAY